MLLKTYVIVTGVLVAIFILLLPLISEMIKQFPQSFFKGLFFQTLIFCYPFVNLGTFLFLNVLPNSPEAGFTFGYFIKIGLGQIFVLQMESK